MADATLDLATVWDQIRERLATSLSPQQNAMLNLTRPLGLVEDTAVLAAPNEFTQTVLESRMRRVLAEALSEQFGRDIRVAVQLEDAPAEAPDEDRDIEPTRRPWSAAEAQRAEEDRASRDRADDGRRVGPLGPRRHRRGAGPGTVGGPGTAPGRPRRSRGLGHHDLGTGRRQHPRRPGLGRHRRPIGRRPPVRRRRRR
jgi:chromosomal replication initiator protein